jgi:ABC-type Fe3+-hydroxamate transport system substrate-binding protein
VVVDAAGDTVRLAAPPTRVVSLIPATTEMLFAIGAGAQVAGRSAWDDYPDAALQVPSAGDGIQPNLEAVIGLHPDLVVLYHSTANAQAARRLTDLGIPVVQLATDRLADVPRMARTLGVLTGHTAAADSLITAFEAGLEEATVARPGTGPGMLILVWDDPPMTVGTGSFLSELVERAGGRNIFGDLPASSAQVSVESVVNRDPDLILTSAEGTPAFAGRPVWQSVPAVREGRFIHVTSSAFSRPSPRAPDAIRELRARIAERP